MAVFAIMAVFSYRALWGTLNAREALDRESEELAELQFAVALMEKDFRNIIARPVRDGFGDEQPALAGGGGSLLLTRLGWANPSIEPRSGLQRVEYHWDSRELRRLGWPVLDRGPGTQAVSQVLLDSIDRVTFAFLDDRGDWQGEWPPSLAREQEEKPWPRALRISIESGRLGVIERTVALTARPAPTGAFLSGGEP